MIHICKRCSFGSGNPKIECYKHSLATLLTDSNVTKLCPLSYLLPLLGVDPLVLKSYCEGGGRPHLTFLPSLHFCSSSAYCVWRWSCLVEHMKSVAWKYVSVIIYKRFKMSLIALTFALHKIVYFKNVSAIF